MVGFVHSPPGEQESSEPKTQSVSEQGKASDPLVEQLLLDVEDYSLSFTNSFLDFDYLNDWIDPRSDPYSMEAGDFGAVTAGGDFSSNGACEQVDYSEGREKMGSLSCLGAEKSAHGSLDKGVGIDCGGEVKVKEEIVVSCGDGKVGELGCLIEEEMGKVNLNGVLSVKEEDGVMDRDINSVGIAEDGGEGIAMNNGKEKGVKNELVIGEDESSADSDSGSETESSSSSSSSASSSDDDDEDEENEDNDNSNRKGSEMEEGEILACSAYDMVAWSADEDDDVEESGPKGPIRSKNELKDLPYVPPVNVTIQPHHQTLPVGNISSIIGAQVIVEGVEKHNPLNEGSILWITESRSPLGIVDEIFGPVKNPYYIVRYNSENDVPVGIQQGTSVSFVQEFANHVLNDKNIYKKGYDASGDNDEELSEEAEFSDDEKEAEYKRLMKMKKRGTSEQKFGNKSMDKKKVKNRPVNQKQNQAFAPQTSTGNVSGNLSVPVDQSQQCVPPFAASGDQRNNVSTGGQAQGSGNGPWSDPALPQMAQFHSYGAPSSGLGMNGIPCQQPQNAGLPSFPAPTQSPGFVTPPGVLTAGVPPQQQQQRMAFPGVFPAINMQWPQQSHPHPVFQMPFPNMLPLQQQMNAGQMFPSNFMPGGQPGFNTGSVALGQGIFNQPPFGLGLHNQSTPLPMNSGQQVVPPNGPQSGSNNDSWPPPSISTTPDSSWNSNQPRHSHGGRQANRRGGGGGRFRGGRGRRHNN
nr:H/ACA ribonucleoprotein complex non-core subunit NAF1-like [Ipomoea batatas]